MKKKLNTEALKNELRGSAFFPTPLPHSKKKAPKEKSQILLRNEDLKTDKNKDVNTDVTTSSRQDVNLKNWQEIIENTETHNSALRITNEERYEIEDLINELKRKHKLKTSMNEVARLGLLFIIDDYKKNKQESWLYKVKKS